MNAPTNTDDIIDSRDVIARIEELEAEMERLTDEDAEDRLTDKQWAESDDGLELAALKNLADEAEGYAADWRHGEALIRDSYFKEYAMQYAEDVGAINADASWPNTCIDWDQAARELQMDYTSVDFDGVTYWIR